SLRGYGEFRDAGDCADHRAELLALSGARLDPDLHPRLNIFAAVCRHINDRFETGTFALHRHHGSAASKNASGCNLDLEPLSVDRRNHAGVSLERTCELLHLAAGLVHFELGNESVELALRFRFANLAIKALDLILRFGDPLLGSREIDTPVLQLAPG